MPNCDYAWRRYKELQKRAMNSLHLNNYSWGIESALSSLLKAIETGRAESDSATLDEAIDRSISSGARLQRSRGPTGSGRTRRPPRAAAATRLRAVDRALGARRGSGRRACAVRRAVSVRSTAIGGGPLSRGVRRSNSTARSTVSTGAS